MKYRHYDLEEFHRDCKKIAKDLAQAGYWPDAWIALDRGGVVAAATIRREFQNLADHKGKLLVKHKDEQWEVFVSDYTDSDRPHNLLIVDDIIDFGLQFEKSIKAFDEIKRDIAAINNHDPTTPKELLYMPRTKHCALIWNVTNKCGVRADFYGQTIDKENNPQDNAWIKFWWEEGE